MKQFFLGVLATAFLALIVAAFLSGTVSVNGQNLNNMVIVASPTPYYAATVPQQTFTVATAVPQQQVVIDLVPTLDTTIDFAATSEAYNGAAVVEEPQPAPRPITEEQLAACILAQLEKRRMAPYCPANPAQPGR